MNRERGLAGANSYAKDLGFDPLAFLVDRLSEGKPAAWLDLCCGSGRALIQAAEQVQARQLQSRVKIVGLDLVPMFDFVPDGVSCLTLQTGSLHDWTPGESFDLITCVHGLHYLGDKLAVICRAAGWLKPQGRFIAHLDLNNVQVRGAANNRRSVARWLREAGLSYNARRSLVTCEGRQIIQPRLLYLGADDQAGPNSTGQPAVNSHYGEPIS